MTATVSSHTLNAVDGTHASGIAVTLSRVGGDVLFQTVMDDGGRLSEMVDLSGAASDTQYEMVFQTGAYFAARHPSDHQQIVSDIVIRFAMPDPEGRYHIPLMLSPNSYSVWWSS